MLFAFAGPHEGLRAPFERNLGAALLAHEIGETARQFALVGVRKRRVQHVGDDEAEHAVAEKFEPLIALAAAPPPRR